MVASTPLHIVDFLEEDQRQALEELGKPVVYPPRATVYWEGQPARSVLMIQKGAVKVSQRGPDGTDVILAIRGVNEIIGDEGVLMGEVRSATLTAINLVEGLDIAADDVLRFVEEQSLWPMMYRAAVYRRRQIEEHNLLGRPDVWGRVVNWLLDLQNKIGEASPGGDWVIESTLSQQDIASCIGASRDAVAVELRRLRDRGWISTARHRIVIHNLAGLQDHAPALGG